MNLSPGRNPRGKPEKRFDFARLRRRTDSSLAVGEVGRRKEGMICWSGLVLVAHAIMLARCSAAISHSNCNASYAGNAKRPRPCGGSRRLSLCSAPSHPTSIPNRKSWPPQGTRCSALTLFSLLQGLAARRFLAKRVGARKCLERQQADFTRAAQAAHRGQRQQEGCFPGQGKWEARSASCGQARGAEPPAAPAGLAVLHRAARRLPRSLPPLTSGRRGRESVRSR